MILDSIRLAVRGFVERKPNCLSKWSKDACATKIFNRTTSPFGQILNAFTLGWYGRSVKKQIKKALNNAIYDNLTRRVTFHQY